jgi:hypothetical protein
MAEKRKIRYPATRAAPRSTKRKRGDPTKVAQRIAKYQQRGLTATQALRELRKRGRVGMRTDRFYALYSTLQADAETRRIATRKKAPVGKVLTTETRRGWLYWVRVFMLDSEGIVRDEAVQVTSRRKISEKRAVEAAMNRLGWQTARYGRRMLGGYVISVNPLKLKGA